MPCRCSRRGRSPDSSGDPPSGRGRTAPTCCTTPLPRSIHSIVCTTPIPQGAYRPPHGRARPCASRGRRAPVLRARSDDSASAFICPTAQGGAIDPSVFVAAEARPGCCGRRMGTAVVCRPPSIPNSSPPTGSRPPGHHIVSSARRSVGGEARRGPVHGRVRRHVLAVLLGQSLGHPELRDRHRPLASVTGPAPSRWAAPGSPPRHRGNLLRGPEERSSSRSAASSGWCITRWHRAVRQPGAAPAVCRPGRVSPRPTASARPGRAGRGAGRGGSVRERPTAVPTAAGVPDPAPSGRSTLAPGE